MAQSKVGPQMIRGDHLVRGEGPRRGDPRVTAVTKGKKGRVKVKETLP